MSHTPEAATYLRKLADLAETGGQISIEQWALAETLLKIHQGEKS